MAFEKEAKEKHKGFRVGLFKKVRTAEAQFYTAPKWQARPASPNPADEWARAKGFKLEDYQKIKKKVRLGLGRERLF